MKYSQFKPHPQLADYIDAFWKVEGAKQHSAKEVILPDGCVDLIFNLGDDCRTEGGELTMQAEKTYMVGIMTTYKETYLAPDNKLVGVRFKPAAFSSFFTYASLDELTDQTIAFDQLRAPDIHKVNQGTIAYLNGYFLNTFNSPKHNLLQVIKDIREASGQISIGALADKNNTTVRQLERNFKRHIGISPKEFANIIRFKNAFSRVKHNRQKQSLSDIAFDCGYYDHAHLTNEIKKYAGITPSQC